MTGLQTYELLVCNKVSTTFLFTLAKKTVFHKFSQGTVDVTAKIATILTVWGFTNLGIMSQFVK